MILDELSNWSRYAGIAGRLDFGFAFLERSLETLEPGRHAISGEDVFAIVSDYRTRPLADLKFEAHETFIDIQVLSRGRETILWAPRDTLTVSEEYSAEKDVAFYRAPEVSMPLVMTSGSFAVFFPTDAHAPGGEHLAATDVRKIVVKARSNGVILAV
jgi:YhcH/YjgK/YiaL family protein